MNALRGQVALVTGGSRGLGRAAARALTEAGAVVAVTGRDGAALQAVVDAGEAALALPGDATDREQVAAAVHATEDRLGPLELLLANAGAFSTGGRLWETDPDAWWRDVEVNLRGPQLALHAVLPAMVERGRGRAVLMGSGFGMVPTPGASAYATSKAAVARLVDTVAGELAGTGVTLLAVSPGMVPTDMTHGFPPGFLEFRPELADPPPEAWTPPERFVDLLLRIAAGELDPLHGRFVRARDDIAEALRAAAAGAEPGTLRLQPWA
jgi:NAD(P)-dependent dehydrogenase (short-subunit alcohol dehydrogenase family)